MVAVEYRLPCLAADPSVYTLVSVTAMCAWRALQSMSCSTHWLCYVSDVGLHALVAVFALWVHALQFPFSLFQWWNVVCNGNIADLACLLVRDCEKVYLFRSPFSLVWMFQPFYEFVYVAHVTPSASCLFSLVQSLRSPPRLGRLASVLP